MMEQIIVDGDELVVVLVVVVVVVVVIVVVGKSWPWRQASGNFVLSCKI